MSDSSISLRERWAGGAETLGLWLTIPSSISAELAAASGADYVCIDTQHGVIDYQQAATMIQAIELCRQTPIVRVPWNEPGIIGKTLDAGAHGVIVPMVNTREQAEAVVAAARYAPDGARSWGPVMASRRHADYRSWARDSVAVVPMIETAEAISNLDDILATPGVDAIYVGPADLSISLGLEPGNNDGNDRFDEALATIVDACRRHDVVPGIHSTGQLVGRRRAQGFRMITVTSDAVAMSHGLAAEFVAARGEHHATDTASMY